MGIKKGDIQHLKTLRIASKPAQKGNIDKVIALYEDRKIEKFKTAEGIILKLLSSRPNTGIKLIEKYGEYISAKGKTPGTKLKPPKVKPIIVEQIKKCSAFVILYIRNVKGEDTEAKIYTRVRDFGGLRQLVAQNFELALGPKSISKLESSKGSLIINMPEGDNSKFLILVDILKENDDFKDIAAVKNGYLAGLYVVRIDYPDEAEAEQYRPRENLSRDTTKSSCYYQYINTELDLTADTLHTALVNKAYTENECWINTLYDNYKDTLLSLKKRKVITRESILQILDKTEDDIKNGLSINDVLPFFKKFNLSVRIFDLFYKCIFKYDPEKRDHHNKVLYCMMVDNHIYTINQNAISLQHVSEEGGLTENIIFASSDYKVKEREAKPNFMIDTINDIFKPRLDEEGEEAKTVFLIHKSNNLIGLLYDLLEVGYKPGIGLIRGNIASLKLEFDGVLYIIKTQQISPATMDGFICVDQEIIYNKMNNAMISTQNRIFKYDHKSYYTEIDIDIFDEYRTIPNVYMFDSKLKFKSSELVEIDVTRAYTAAFIKIDRIPIFNEFDCFTCYTDQEIEELNLYIIESTTFNIFCNKRFNLCYGRFIDKLSNIKIIAFKRPSFIKKVDYKQIIDELYDMNISENAEQDVYIKKLIANVNFGLLEKSVNHAEKAHLFDNLSEARHYEKEYGGNINFIRQFKEVITEGVSDLDVVVDVDENGEFISKKDVIIYEDGTDNISRGLSYVETHNPLHILSFKATAKLRNGFRYIKELLLQHHALVMFEAYQRLTENNIKVFSVKTDAYTINASDLVLCQKVLNFEKNIGNWRVSKTEDIIFPYGKQAAMIDNLQITITDPVSVELEVLDEWDTKAICKLFEDHKRVMVRAEYAGSGKTYACKYMEQLGHKVLFVCPTNVLDLNDRDSGCTLNEFFSVGMTEDETKNIKKFDDNSYDVIDLMRYIC